MCAFASSPVGGRREPEVLFDATDARFERNARSASAGTSYGALASIIRHVPSGGTVPQNVLTAVA